MNNTREYERKPIEVELGGSISKIEGFTLLDISQSGALIESVENMKIGSNYLIDIVLSDKMDSLPFKVQVMRCELVGSKENTEGDMHPQYEIGLKFIDPREDNLKKLSRFISSQEQKA